MREFINLENDIKERYPMEQQQGESFYDILNELTTLQNGGPNLDNKLSDLLNVVPLPMAVIKVLNGQFVGINHTWSKKLEYLHEEVIGKTDLELSIFVNSEDRQQLAGLLLEQGEIQDQEVKVKTKTGNILTCLVFGKLIILNNEQYFLLVIMDTTEKKQTEEKVLKLAAIVESSEDAIISMNLDYHITSWNKGAEKIYGYSEVDIIGKPISILLPPLKKRHQGIHQKVLQNLNIDLFEGKAFRKDGTEIFISVKISLIRNTAGNVIGLSVIHRDITEKKKLEEELLKSQKLESLGILAGGIAHDFNNYLAAMMSNLQLAGLRLNQGTDITSLLKSTQDILLQATSLTQQLLAFSKGGAPIKKVASLNDIIHDTVKLALRGSSTTCKIHFPVDLWMAEVDIGQIMQLLTNLLINASQAMPDGGVITIEGENVTINGLGPLPLKPGKYVKLSVVDQGIGISPENLGKVFDPYFTTKKLGSGLGLTICYSIIRQHDGYIGVESGQGFGATFYFYLPAISDVQNYAPINQPHNHRGQIEQGKILIMDDEKRITIPLSQILQEVGYEVDLATDGSEAIFKYIKAQEEGRPYDVVMLDLTVPGGMGGEQTMERLIRINPKVRAIVSSGYSNSPVMSNPRQFHFRAVVTKPYKVEELRQVLLAVINDIC